jgi:hypothetical protein
MIQYFSLPALFPSKWRSDLGSFSSAISHGLGEIEVAQIESLVLGLHSL